MRSNTHPGTFIVLEGADGSGTTTQAKALATRLKAQGYAVLVTAEPTTGPIGKLLRQYLNAELLGPDGAEQRRHMMTLLFSADRIAHLATEVEPALRQGYVVICDRYVMSTLAYQTEELDDFEWIAMVSRKALLPDVTVILQVDPKVGMARLKERGGHREIYEELPVQKRVADNYRRLTHFPVGAVLSMGADNEVEQVTDDLLELVRPHIKELR